MNGIHAASILFVSILVGGSGDGPGSRGAGLVSGEDSRVGRLGGKVDLCATFDGSKAGLWGELFLTGHAEQSYGDNVHFQVEEHAESRRIPRIRDGEANDRGLRSDAVVEEEPGFCRGLDRAAAERIARALLRTSKGQ